MLLTLLVILNTSSYFADILSCRYTNTSTLSPTQFADILSCRYSPSHSSVFFFNPSLLFMIADAPTQFADIADEVSTLADALRELMDPEGAGGGWW